MSNRVNPPGSRCYAGGQDLIGFDCLAEMVVLASALSIQDPRDRPQDKREAVDRAHEEFRDDASDFTQLANLWKFFDEEFVHKKSNRKLFEVCRLRDIHDLLMDARQ